MDEGDKNKGAEPLRVLSERKKALEASKVPLNYFVKLTADCDESIPAALDRATRKPNFCDYLRDAASGPKTFLGSN